MTRDQTNPTLSLLVPTHWISPGRGEEQKSAREGWCLGCKLFRDFYSAKISLPGRGLKKKTFFGCIFLLTNLLYQLF